MTGKSHIACNVSVAITTGSILRITEKKYNLIGADRIVPFIQGTVYPFLTGRRVMPAFLWWMLAGFLFLLGSVLPDCDTKSSLVGRVVHLPIEHRTWTHSVWFLIPCAIFTWYFPVGFYLLAGYFLHLLFDSMSYGGVCWFYPLSKYRTYSGGAKVKSKHWCKLYRTGQMSEAVVDVVVIAVVTVILAYCLINQIYV